jgi:hypothetical protein
VNVPCVLAGSTILDSEPHGDARPEDRDHDRRDEGDSAPPATRKGIEGTPLTEVAHHGQRHVELLVVRIECPLGGL